MAIDRLSIQNWSRYIKPMYLRTVTTKSNGKAYRYVQLVQSYRRSSDGMPATRVLANLGKLPAKTVANLKIALKASRAGKRVVLAPVRLRSNPTAEDKSSRARGPASGPPRKSRAR